MIGAPGGGRGRRARGGRRRERCSSDGDKIEKGGRTSGRGGPRNGHVSSPRGGRWERSVPPGETQRFPIFYV
jgi:hypothetical protein